MPVSSIEQETGTVIFVSFVVPVLSRTETNENKKAANFAAKTSKLVVLRYGHFTLIPLFYHYLGKKSQVIYQLYCNFYNILDFDKFVFRGAETERFGIWENSATFARVNAFFQFGGTWICGSPNHINESLVISNWIQRGNNA